MLSEGIEKQDQPEFLKLVFTKLLEKKRDLCVRVCKNVNSEDIALLKQYVPEIADEVIQFTYTY